MAEKTDAKIISADVVAKLQNAIDGTDAISPDEMMVILTEALSVIEELVALADQPQDGGGVLVGNGLR